MRFISLAGATLLLAALGGAPLASAQETDDAILKQLEELRKGQEQIQKDLAELKKLVQSSRAPSGPKIDGMAFDLGDNAIIGPPTAKLTLFEFTDYQ